MLEKLTGTEIPILESKAIEYICAQEHMLTKFNKLSGNDGKFRDNKNLKLELAKHIKMTYAWWIKKRQSLNKPLLRVYWPRTLASDQNPELVFRARERERYKLRKKKNNDIDQYYKLFQHLKDTEYLQFLSYLVTRREQIKKVKELCFLSNAASENGKVLKPIKNLLLKSRKFLKKVDVSSQTLLTSTQEVLFFSDKVRRQMPAVLASGYSDTDAKKKQNPLKSRSSFIDKRVKKQKKLRVKNNEELAANFIKCLEVYTPKRERQRELERIRQHKVRRNINSFPFQKEDGETQLVPPQRFLFEDGVSSFANVKNKYRYNWSYVDSIHYKRLIELKKAKRTNKYFRKKTIHRSNKRKAYEMNSRSKKNTNTESGILEVFARELAEIGQKRRVVPTEALISNKTKFKFNSVLEEIVQDDESFDQKISVSDSSRCKLLKTDFVFSDHQITENLPNFSLAI